MEVETKSLFFAVGGILLMIVSFYIKEILRDVKMVQELPKLMERADKLITKVEMLIVSHAVFEEKFRNLEKRLERIEQETKSENKTKDKFKL